MNGVPDKYTLSLTQTAKGIFYVDKMSVEADNEEELLKRMDSLAEKVKDKLNELNSSVFTE